ncbi:MAG: PAS domain S-box protein [Pseudomonadota bacterium]
MSKSAPGESDMRFRQLAESINVVFWLIDANNSDTVYISPGYERIWGRSCASLFESPSSWLDAILPEDKGRVQAAVLQHPTQDYDIEYRIRRPNGEIRWIHDRAFPVRNAEGQVYRIAGVAEDITLRKTTALALDKTSEVLAAICAAQSRFIAHPDHPANFDELLTVITRLMDSEFGFLAEISRDADGTLGLKQHGLVWNENIPTMDGSTDRREYSLHHFQPWYDSVLNTGRPTIRSEPSAENPAPRTFLGLPLYDGEEMIGMIGLANRPGGYREHHCLELEPITTTCVSLMLAYRNYTARKQVEENLHLLQLAVDNSKVALFWISPDARVLNVNNYACQSLGYDRDEMMGKYIGDFDPDYDYQTRDAIWTVLRRDGINTFERRHRRKDGTIFPVESTANYITYGGKEFSFSIIQDITEKKAIEKQIRFLNQIYDAVSRTNQALLECADEHSLYRRICQIAVEYGGMKMAWIGKSADGEFIKPVACYGSGVEYLDDIVISTRADLPEGCGPSGEAFRTQRVVMVQDFETDPSTALCRKHGRPHSWKACASIGILHDGKSHAVLTLYHPDKYSFSQKIIELMAEMSANISFGLARFDLAATQQQAMTALGESATRYHEVIETAMDGFWMVDTEARLLEVNDAYVSRSG